MARGSRIALIALLAAALLVAGCGGSSSSDDTGAPGSTAPATTTHSTTDDTLGAAEFCKEADKILQDLDQQLAPALDPSAVPENVEKTLKGIEEAYAKVIAIAPAEIKPDLQVLSGAITQLTQAYAKVDFNATEALAAVIPLLNSQDLMKASQDIGAWGAANCQGVN